MVMEAVEKKPHIEDETATKTKKEDDKADPSKESLANKKKPTKLDQCKLQIIIYNLKDR